MKITYWSDYACPYCYIGETYLKQAIADLGIGDQVEVEMKAFELDPDACKEYAGMILYWKQQPREDTTSTFPIMKQTR